MFKKFGFIAIVLCVAFSLCTQTFARTYVDSMASVISDNIVSYTNLDVHNFPASAPHILPDATALSVSGSAYIGHVSYRVTGATLVSASIYSQSGTFVSQHPENTSTYMLGVFQDNMDFLSLQNVTQALFCPATDSVYTYSGGLKQKYTNISSYFFGPVITPPSGVLVGYGVNFYFSYDGVNYIHASAAQTDLQFDTREMFCYETYSAAVSETAKYVRVEINDVSAIPLLDGGAYPKDKKFGTKLASVTLSGEELILGEPEVPISIPSVSSSGNNYSDKSEDDYSDSEQSVPDPEPSVVEDSVPIVESVPSENEKSSSQKFEGTITSSSKSSRSASSKQEPVSEESSESTREIESVSPQESAPSREEPVVYEISRGNTENDTADTVINGIIISVSGAIVLRLATMAIKK